MTFSTIAFSTFVIWNSVIGTNSTNQTAKEPQPIVKPHVFENYGITMVDRKERFLREPGFQYLPQRNA